MLTASGVTSEELSQSDGKTEGNSEACPAGTGLPLQIIPGNLSLGIPVWSTGHGPAVAVEIAATAAQLGAERTRSMAASAGRSSYVPEAVLRDLPDPGACAVATWMAALAAVMKRV